MNCRIPTFNRERRFLSGYDLRSSRAARPKKGCSYTLRPCRRSRRNTHATRQFRRVRLSWRKSTGSRRSLGWIPFKTGCDSGRSWSREVRPAMVVVMGQPRSRGVPDSCGNYLRRRSRRWYLNACVAVPVAEPRSSTRRDLGIDLGLEDLVATSDGRKCRPHNSIACLEAKLCIAQRRGKKDRVRAIHAKIANRRKDSLHQFSTRLVRAYDTIFVGNVNASACSREDTARQVGARCGLVGVSNDAPV